MIDGEEDCRSLEELAGTPTGRSMEIGMVSYNMHVIFLARRMHDSAT